MKLVDRRAECGMLDRLVEAPLDELSRHLTDHGVSCTAIPSESVRRTVGELIANPRPAERQDVRHALLGLEVVLPDGQASARFGGGP
jgi:glycolate oxidase